MEGRGISFPSNTGPHMQNFICSFKKNSLNSNWINVRLDVKEWVMMQTNKADKVKKSREELVEVAEAWRSRKGTGDRR